METKTKKELIEESGFIFKTQVNDLQEARKTFISYTFKRRFKLDPKPILIAAGLVVAGYIVSFIASTTREKMTAFAASVLAAIAYIAILLLIVYFITKSKTKKIFKNSNVNTPPITCFYKNGIIDNGENTIIVNKYSEIESIEFYKNYIFIVYHNNATTILDENVLSQEQIDFINKLIKDIQNNPKSTAKTADKEVEKPNKTKRALIIFVVIVAVMLGFSLLAFLVTDNTSNNSLEEVNFPYIKHEEELELLKVADVTAYSDYLEIVDSQEKYNDYNSTDYYVRGEENTILLYANFPNEFTVYVEEHSKRGTIVAEWGEWEADNQGRYVYTYLTLRANENSYGYVTITNDQDEREMKIFVDNVNYDLVPFSQIFNEKYIYYSIEEKQSKNKSIIHNSNVLIEQVAKDHYLHSWTSKAPKNYFINRWFCVNEFGHGNYPCSAWVITNIDNDNFKVSIDELTFESEPGELKFDDIEKTIKPFTLSLIENDNDYYEIFNEKDERIGFLREKIKGTLFVGQTKFKVYDIPNGKVTKTMTSDNSYCYVSVVRAEKGDIWYCIGPDMWIKEDPSFTYDDLSK